jgi:hypothetical protein
MRGRWSSGTSEISGIIETHRHDRALRKIRRALSLTISPSGSSSGQGGLLLHHYPDEWAA